MERKAPVDLSKEEFRKIGHELVDKIADFFETIRQRPVTPGEPPAYIRDILGSAGLPENGVNPEVLVRNTSNLLFDHSLLNGHPRFGGYITSSPAPIGALADMLAAAVNANVGAYILSPVATEIEKQTIRWLAELVGVGPTYGGLLVSGGNVANITAFFAAKNAKMTGNSSGDIHSIHTVYYTKATHTWIEKAMRMSGMDTHSSRLIKTGRDNQMDLLELEQSISDDIKNRHIPAIVVATAGDVSTGAVDDLRGISRICKKFNVWFHVDGAYGAAAACLPQLESTFDGFQEADSIAMDPHKWLYSPLEAGCTLLKDPRHLVNMYSSHPEYYNFDDADADDHALNFYEYGLQNSRGFRALKVWFILQQAGRQGFIQMISNDIALAQSLFNRAKAHKELEALTSHLSITTMRYRPQDAAGDSYTDKYLDTLNKALLDRLQKGGKIFLSNAVIEGKYCLRYCIVNFRTSEKEIEEIIEIIVAEGRRVHNDLRQQTQIQPII